MVGWRVRSCLGDATFAAYVDGDLTAAEVSAADAHVDECPVCRTHLSALATANTLRSFVSPSMSVPPTTASAPVVTELVPGSSLGRYLVEAELGRGGMGVVVRAFDPELERAVAIKLVAPSVPELASGAWRARLRAEARAMARLRHPNVVAVHDVGVVGDRLFIAMELVDGDTLTRWLARSGRARALALWLDAARGVAAAHAAGLVHGDIKPDNILVGRDGRALIGDFGLARSQRGPSEHGLAGTPPYMAPEQWEGGVVDAAADQFALAVTLCEAIAGARPWPSTVSPMDRPPATRPLAMPAWLWRIVARALSAEPRDRYPSVDAMIDAVVQARRGRRRRRVAFIFGAVVVVGVVVGRAWAVDADRQCEDPVARPAALVRAVEQACGDRSSPACANVWARIDRWQETWRSASIAACQVATGGTTRALDPRIRCLDHTIALLETLVDRTGPGAWTAAEAYELSGAITALPAPETCVHQQAERPYPVASVERAAALGQASQWVIEAEADDALGRFREGAASIGPRLGAIEATGDPGLTARAFELAGRFEMIAGTYQRAGATLQRALSAAAEAHDDVALARILITIAAQVAPTWPLDLDAPHWQAARAAIVRAGHPPELEASLLAEQAEDAHLLNDQPVMIDLLERAVAIERSSTTPPQVRAQTLVSLCTARVGFNRSASMAACDEAIAIARTTLGPDHPTTIEVEGSPALGWVIANRDDLARPLVERTLDRLGALYGPEHPLLGPWLFLATELANNRKDAAASAAYLARLERIDQGTRTDRGVEQLNVQLKVARFQINGSEGAKGRAAAERLRDEAARRFGDHHPTTIKAIGLVAASDFDAGHYVDAVAGYRRMIEADVAVFGSEHPNTIAVEFSLAHALILTETPAADREARDRLRHVLARSEADSASAADANTFLAEAYLHLGDAAAAVPVAERGAVLHRPADTIGLAYAELVLGRALWGQGTQRARAVKVVRAARARLAPDDEVLGPWMDSWLGGNRTE